MWLGLVGWGTCVDWIRGIVVTRVCCLAWSGLVPGPVYRAAISGYYDVICWFFALTNDSGEFPWLLWGGTCHYPLLSVRVAR